MLLIDTGVWRERELLYHTEVDKCHVGFATQKTVLWLR